MSVTLVANPEKRRGFDQTPNAPRSFRVRRAPACEPPFDDERDSAEVFSSWTPPGVTIAPPQTTFKPSTTAAHAASRYVQVCLEVLNGFRPPSHLRTLAGTIEFAEMLRQLRFRRNGSWRAGELDKAAALDGSEPRSSNEGTLRFATPSANATPQLRPLRAPVGDRAHEPVPVTHANRSGETAAFRLLRLRVSEPLPGKAEAVAIITHAGLSLAIAMRLEVRGSTWICTIFQVV